MMSTQIGIDGFKWEKIEVGSNRRSRHEDMYIYQNGKQTHLFVRREFLELADMHINDALTLYGQGKAIFMFQKEKGGEIVINTVTKGAYQKIGGKELALKLLKTTDEAKAFEVVDSSEGYILFRPIKE